MVWWLLAAGAAFYLLFNNTAPKAKDVFKPKPKPGGVSGAGASKAAAMPGKAKAGTKAETPEAFAGAIGAAVYDPAKNPFRTPPAGEPVGGGGGGSFDDILPDSGEPEEVPADEEVAEDGDFGEADDLDESNGQY